MYIPVFEIKDSFIIKHKLQYDTSCNIGDPFKMMFTDYDMARKSQTVNAENFSGITILNLYNDDDYLYFENSEESYKIYLDGDLVEKSVFSGTTVFDGVDYQQFTVSDGLDWSQPDERVEVKLYQQELESGTTFWQHTSYVTPDIWTVTGLSPNNNQWISSGTTTVLGYTSGNTNWYTYNTTPMFQYTSNIVGYGSTYIRLEKKIQEYLFNNLMQNYDTMFYTITSLSHCFRDFPDIYTKFLQLPSSSNFDLTLNDSSLTITPKYNVSDIYYNYDTLTIGVHNLLGNSREFHFETECLYNKYNLEDFLLQLGVESGTTISNTVSSNSVNLIDYILGDYYMRISIPDTHDLFENTYVELETNEGEFYNVLITGITLGEIEVISPLDFPRVTGEYLVGFRNLDGFEEVSDVLQNTYENINQGEYRKHSNIIQQKVYNGYAEILNKLDINVDLRKLVTGLIFQNDKNKMVLKVFDPAGFIDERLVYEPIEIVRIGKDRKTSIPVTITQAGKVIN